MNAKQKLHHKRIVEALDAIDSDRALDDRQYVELLEEILVDVESRINAKKDSDG